MQILAIIAASLFLSAGYAYNEEENLLGLPVEYDIFGLDFREDLDEDRDIFKEGSDTYEPKPDTPLQKLCQEFDLLLDNQNIDCSSLKLVPKGLTVYEHNVQKRDADEIEQEGSGEPEGKPITEATNEETETKSAEFPQPEEVPKESQDPPSGAEEPQPEKEQENTEAPEEAAKEEDVPKEVPAEAPIEQELTSEAPKEKVAEEAPSEAPVEQVVQVELTSEIPKEEAVGPQATEPSADDNKSEAPSEAVTEQIFVKEETVLLGAVPKKGRKLTPEEEKPVTGAAAPAEAVKSDSEKVNEQQSGVAILESAGSAGTLEASDNSVKNMATNAEIKGNTNVEPKSGESAKDTQEGRQDTKVLIILFAAVVIVGAAAFAYNFIKKRKAKNAEAARSENGGNALQRNLQNVSSKEKDDPEHGTELKPLMKPGEKPLVEYKDEKGNGKTEVAN